MDLFVHPSVIQLLSSKQSGSEGFVRILLTDLLLSSSLRSTRSYYYSVGVLDTLIQVYVHTTDTTKVCFTLNYTQCPRRCSIRVDRSFRILCGRCNTMVVPSSWYKSLFIFVMFNFQFCSPRRKSNWETKFLLVFSQLTRIVTKNTLPFSIYPVTLQLLKVSRYWDSKKQRSS